MTGFVKFETETGQVWISGDAVEAVHPAHEGWSLLYMRAAREHEYVKVKGKPDDIVKRLEGREP